MSLTSLDTGNPATIKVASSVRRVRGSGSIRSDRRRFLLCRKPNPKSARTASKFSNFSDKKSIGKRLRTLQRLVPGGRNMEAPEVLFHQTADYILKLRSQVQFLEFLTNLYSKSGDHNLTVESCASSGIDNL